MSEADKILAEIQEEKRRAFKVVEADLKVVRRGKKTYSYWVLKETTVPSVGHYVIMPMSMWERILELYDKYLELQGIVEKYFLKLISILELELDMRIKSLKELHHYIVQHEMRAIDEKDREHWNFRAKVVIEDLKYYMEKLNEVKEIKKKILSYIVSCSEM